MTKTNQRVSDNATISSVTYEVNSIGQRESVAQTFLSASSTPTTANIQWGYNATGEKPRRLVGVLDRREVPCLEEVSSREAAANQLTKADHSDTAQNRAYNYDGIGNRLTSNSPSGASPASAGYTPNALNQYTAVNTFTPTHDDDGNQIDAQVKPLTSSSLVSCVFEWDAENRKVEVKNASATTLVTHYYDAQSRRIASTAVGVITLYIYQGWNVIAEYTVSATVAAALSRINLWGPDLSQSMQGAGGVGGLLMVSEIESSNTSNYFPLYDGNGNVTEYINSNEEVVAHYEYDPFGNTTVASEDKADDFAYRFSTKPIEKATGLYYYGYRWYGPLTGRWSSRDPIEESGGLNLYGFVANAAMEYIDRLGKVIATKEGEDYRNAVESALEGITNSKLSWKEKPDLKKVIRKRNLGAGNWYILCVDQKGDNTWWTSLSKGIDDKLFRYLTQFDRYSMDKHGNEHVIVGNARGAITGDERGVDLSLKVDWSNYVSPDNTDNLMGVNWKTEKVDFKLVLWHELVGHSILEHDHPLKSENAFIVYNDITFEKLKKKQLLLKDFTWIRKVNVKDGVDPTVDYENSFRKSFNYKKRRPTYYDYYSDIRGKGVFFGAATERGTPLPEMIPLEQLEKVKVK